MSHFLLNSDTEVIYSSEKFNREELKKNIIAHLEVFPDGMVTHEKGKGKEYDPYNVELINIYECNDKKEPSLVVFKGIKTFHKPLT